MDEARLRSSADPASEAFQRNAAAMQAVADELRSKLDTVRLGGPQKSRERHVSRGTAVGGRRAARAS